MQNAGDGNQTLQAVYTTFKCRILLNTGSPKGFLLFQSSSKKSTEKRLGLLQKREIKLVLLITQLFDTETETNTSLTTSKSNEAEVGQSNVEALQAHKRQNMHCINSLLEENG